MVWAFVNDPPSSPHQVKMFAPNTEQMHVVNHCEGKPVEGKRNVLQESARIARGDVTDLAKLDVKDFDALIIPGAIGSQFRHYNGSFLAERYSRRFR